MIKGSHLTIEQLIKRRARGYHHSEATKEKIRQKHLNLTQETREQMSRARKGKTWEEIFGKEHAAEMKRVKSLQQQYRQLGENNSMYTDGLGSIYNNQRQIALKVAKQHFIWICHVCGQEDKKHTLIVHHINQDRNDNCYLNLMICCRSCHQKMHNAIRYPEKEFSPLKMASGVVILV